MEEYLSPPTMHFVGALNKRHWYGTVGSYVRTDPRLEKKTLSLGKALLATHLYCSEVIEFTEY
jgi:hypothetical protein